MQRKRHAAKKIPMRKSRENEIKTIFPSLVGYLSKESVRAISSTNLTFKLLCKQKSTWKILYQAHFGSLYFHDEFKEQYKAEVYKNQRQIYLFGSPSFANLENHITGYKNWNTYYFAYINEHKWSGDKSKVPGLCLTALKAGDLRAKKLLCDHFYNALLSERPILQKNVEEYQALLASDFIHDEDTQHFICLAHCFKYHSATYQKDFLRRTALEHFFKFVDYANLNVDKFLEFAIKVLFILQIITSDQEKNLRNKNLTLTCHNTLEVVLHPDITDPLLANYIARPLLMEMLRNLALINGHELNRLALGFSKTKNWDRNIFKILIMQKCASIQDAPDEIKQTMMHKIASPDKAPALVRCAMTFVHLAQHDFEKAEYQYQLAVITDHQIFTRFLQESENYGFDQKNQQELAKFIKEQDEPKRKKRKVCHPGK